MLAVGRRVAVHIHSAQSKGASEIGEHGDLGRSAERGLPRFGRFFKGGETGRVRRRNRPRHDRLSLKERGGEGFDAAAEAEAADFAFASAAAAAAVGPAGLGSGIAKRGGSLGRPDLNFLNRRRGPDSLVLVGPPSEKPFWRRLKSNSYENSSANALPV